MDAGALISQVSFFPPPLSPFLRMPEAKENGTEGFQELIGEGEGISRGPVSKRCLLVQPPVERHTT